MLRSEIVSFLAVQYPKINFHINDHFHKILWFVCHANGTPINGNIASVCLAGGVNKDQLLADAETSIIRFIQTGALFVPNYFTLRTGRGLSRLALNAPVYELVNLKHRFRSLS